MSDEQKKIDVKTEVVVRKAANFREVAHKATAGVSDDEAIERNTIGSFGDSTDGEDDEESEL